MEIQLEHIVGDAGKKQTIADEAAGNGASSNRERCETSAAHCDQERVFTKRAEDYAIEFEVPNGAFADSIE
ncbi:hypothetical protein AAVH_10632 [Aphelenchoides avenae]|nr:hypothetical protein AAVH_10632 [Aphelenchus avenae]